MYLYYLAVQKKTLTIVEIMSRRLPDSRFSLYIATLKNQEKKMRASLFCLFVLTLAAFGQEKDALKYLQYDTDVILPDEYKMRRDSVMKMIGEDLLHYVKSMRARLDFMPGSTVPVIRQPFAAGDPQPFWCIGQPIGQHHCYDLHNDPAELENRLGGADERAMIELLRVALRAIDAPLIAPIR